MVSATRVISTHDEPGTMPPNTNLTEAFRKDGFVNAGPVLPAEDLTELTLEYDRLVTLDAQTLGNERDGVFPYRAMLNFRSDVFRRAIRHPQILELAMTILGPDIRFWWDQGINKSAGSGSFIDWHQDNGYERGRTAPYLTCWLALDDSTLENGGLQIIPGSHEGGIREHTMEGAHAVIRETPEESEARALDAKAGDLLLFSSFLIHRTVGNTTRNRNRRAWVVQYCRGDQHNEDTGEVYDNRPWVVREGQPVDEPWSERPFDLRRDRA